MFDGLVGVAEIKLRLDVRHVVDGFVPVPHRVRGELKSRQRKGSKKRQPGGPCDDQITDRTDKGADRVLTKGSHKDEHSDEDAQ